MRTTTGRVQLRTRCLLGALTFGLSIALAGAAGAAPAGAAPAAPAAASAPNRTVLTYDAATGWADTYKMGVQAMSGVEQQYQFSTGWTHIAMSRTTALFYNADTGAMTTGTMSANGVYAGKKTMKATRGLTNVVASCDSAVAYSRYGSVMTTYKLSGGVITAVHVVASPGAFDTVVASCDTLFFYDSTTGHGVVGMLTNGIWMQTFDYGNAFSTGWDHVEATDDSVAMQNSTNQTEAIGALSGGQFVWTGNPVWYPENQVVTAVGGASSVYWQCGAQGEGYVFAIVEGLAHGGEGYGYLNQAVLWRLSAAAR